jgi:hypothetical protein
VVPPRRRDKRGRRYRSGAAPRCGAPALTGGRFRDKDVAVGKRHCVPTASPKGRKSPGLVALKPLAGSPREQDGRLCEPERPRHARPERGGTPLRRRTPRARMAPGKVIHSAGGAPTRIIPPAALHRRQAPARIASAPSRVGGPSKRHAVWTRGGRRRPGKGGVEEPGLDASPLSDRLSSTMHARANPGAHGRQDEDVR